LNYRVIIAFLVFGIGFLRLNAQQLPEAYYRLQAAIDMQDRAKALQWADSCKALKPMRFQYLVGIGDAFLLNNKYSDALEYFTKSESARSGSGSYKLAKTYCIIGDTAKCFEWLVKNLESAQREKESVILLEPVFEKYHSSISWKNIWSEDWYTSLDRTIAEAEYLNANLNYEESLELLNTRIKGTKSRYALYELRGDAYLNLNNPSVAVDDYSIAYKKSRKNPFYLVKIAEALFVKKQYPQAIKKLDQAIEKSGGNPKYHLIRANAYNEMSQPANGLQDIKYYLEFYPNDTKAIELLSQSAYDAGQYVDALFALAKLSKTNPSNPKYRYLRGLTYIKTEQSRLAITELDFAIANEYNVSDAYFYKGIALYNLGELKEACQCFSISHQYGKFEAQEWMFKLCKN
jgi:Tfp pilus assembly protein PilF